MSNNLPEHLGGHFNVCHIDDGILEFAIKKFKTSHCVPPESESSSSYLDFSISFLII